jgi:hypothetical protein
MRGMLLLGAVVTLGGCASVTRGFNDQVQFNSNPPEAQVRTSMGHVCVTPCALQFSRKDEFVAVFSKPGFETQQIAVHTRLAPGGAAGFAGNVLVGGVVGMGVDAASGATLDHCPNPVTVTLRPLARGQPQRDAPPLTPQECAYSAGVASTDSAASGQ